MASILKFSPSHSRGTRACTNCNKKTMSAARGCGSHFSVVEVDDHVKLQAFQRLARSYLNWLGEDLGFQAVDDELDTLPGVYATSNRGVLLVAACDGGYAGTAALRPLQGKQADGIDEIEGISVDHIAELKRLYVDTPYQKHGMGEALTRACLEAARRYGYKAVVCDTLERLSSANALYERIGFRKTMPYSYCPLDGPLHFIFTL
jgi:putative acetyltransferase